MSQGVVHLDKQGPTAVAAVDNPPVNSLNREIIRQLGLVFDQLAADENLRAVVLTGRGKAFAAGADIKGFPDLNRHTAEEYALAVTAVHQKIQELPCPVIAAVNGYALGGGCELAMACDIRIASQKAKFGQPEVALGLIPGAGGTQRLPRLVPAGKAKMLIFPGQIIDAAEAERIGLVDQVVEPGRELAEATALAEKIMANGPVAVRFAKKAVNRGLQMPLHDALCLEAMLFGELFETKDAKEGVTAFMEKRKPDFQGK